jgi:hypothetical protein
MCAAEDAPVVTTSARAARAEVSTCYTPVGASTFRPNDQRESNREMPFRLCRFDFHF